MTPKALFDQRRQEIIGDVKNQLLFPLDDTTYRSYQQLLYMLSSLNFSNKSHFKGEISHFIIDSYTGDTNLGERLIEFGHTL
jgi:hypothetical protein